MSRESDSNNPKNLALPYWLESRKPQPSAEEIERKKERKRRQAAYRRASKKSYLERKRLEASKNSTESINKQDAEK
jgi:hypothetical protein